MFDNCFLNSESLTIYEDAIAQTTQILKHWCLTQPNAYSGANPIELAGKWSTYNFCPDFGKPLSEVLQEVETAIVQHSVAVSHPTCIAHLHCPPLIPALAAEVLINATNQSMDSWDQSPAATLVEQHLVHWLCQRFGYDSQADGIFTSGGTQSNFMGLLLARDRYSQSRLNWSIQQKGLPPESHRWRILCSEVAHFTVRQSAALLGLGEQAVVAIATDQTYQLCPKALRQKLTELQQQDLLPIALVATAGTTDFGSIDPILEMAEIAQEYGLWLHVDAAYGGALMISDRERHRLNGIHLADSITVDFHKLFYQPISCGAFLLKDRSNFNLIRLHADYLNPEENSDLGIPDLVTKSIQTTRRFDALKLFVCLQVLGQSGFANLIETTIDLATQTANLITNDPDLELACSPQINSVVFRYRASNQINQKIRLQLIEQGEAIIAQTKIADLIYLKFTLLNPRSQLSDVRSLLQNIKQIGQAEREVQLCC
jgi:L-2,4-diaminobutyrate decarboxylase